MPRPLSADTVTDSQMVGTVRPPDKSCDSAVLAQSSKPPHWEIKTGAHKRGLKPQICRESRGEILPGKSGLLLGPLHKNQGPIGGFAGPIGPDSSAPHSHGGRAEIANERALFGPIGAFWAKPPSAKLLFGFP